MKARAYEGMHNLYAMMDLLAEGRKADSGTYYIHRGDLQCDCSKDGKEVVKWAVGQSGNRPTDEKNKGN